MNGDSPSQETPILDPCTHELGSMRLAVKKWSRDQNDIKMTMSHMEGVQRMQQQLFY